MYFAPPLNGFHFELGTGAGVKKTRIMMVPGSERSLMISSAVWIQYTNVTDRRTDRRTEGRRDTLREQRPRIRIASRANKQVGVTATGRSAGSDVLHLCGLNDRNRVYVES